ncbi:hypothetical protein N9R79_06000 [Vibrio sp.]|nr:hypothetical protein [Vibrio sp.]
MLLAAILFIIATFMVTLSTKLLPQVDGEMLPIIVAAPVLWATASLKPSNMMTLGCALVYGIAMTYQPIDLSLMLLLILPILSIIFSQYSSNLTVWSVLSITFTLIAGVVIGQLTHVLEGSALATVIQSMSVIGFWWGSYHWSSHSPRLWSTGTLIPVLWFLGFEQETALLSTLFVMGICLFYAHKSYSLGSVVYWALPTFAFVTLIALPTVEVNNTIFVVWLSLLGVAWMTDYILKCIANGEKI